MIIALANNATHRIYFFLLFPCLLVLATNSVLFIKAVLSIYGLQILEGVWSTCKN